MKTYNTMLKIKGLDIKQILELEIMILNNDFTRLYDEIQANQHGRFGIGIDDSNYNLHYYDFGNGRTKDR